MITASIDTYTFTWYLYVLVNPLNGDEFYLGMTVDPKVRMQKHIRRALNQNVKQYPHGWYIRALLEAGLKPEMKVIEIMETRNDHDTLRASAREKELIRQYKKQGKAWTNHTYIR